MERQVIMGMRGIHVAWYDALAKQCGYHDTTMGGSGFDYVWMI